MSGLSFCIISGKTGKQRKGRAVANKTPEVASRSSRRRTQELDSEVHTVKVDEEITLNISDDGRQLKKSLREVRQESQRSSRGRKRTRSAEEDADTEEEEEATMMPSKKKSLTVVLTRQDKELRKLVSQSRCFCIFNNKKSNLWELSMWCMTCYIFLFTLSFIKMFT